jgi:hypothetical protein
LRKKERRLGLIEKKEKGFSMHPLLYGIIKGREFRILFPEDKTLIFFLKTKAIQLMPFYQLILPLSQSKKLLKEGAFTLP